MFNPKRAPHFSHIIFILDPFLSSLVIYFLEAEN